MWNGTRSRTRRPITHRKDEGIEEEIKIACGMVAMARERSIIIQTVHAIAALSLDAALHERNCRLVYDSLRGHSRL